MAKTGSAQTSSKNWTVMLYMAADEQTVRAVSTGDLQPLSEFFTANSQLVNRKHR